MENTKDKIAVVGVGCQFPGGEGLDSFWKVLLEGKNCAVEIPTERFDTTCWYDADGSKPGKTQTTRAALIDGLNVFDHRFFGITETEADLMDPQQKLLLQCTHRTLEDAGISMESISGSRTGVYIGLMNKDYEMLQNKSSTTTNHYSSTGTATSMASNRISFVFNLTGPSFTIDSACSSSLVALHLACQAIKQGDCQMALCGGVSCIIEPGMFVALSKAQMISPGGTSRPFSSEADGYGRGEGCGVVLLKPLEDAINDYNKVWGIISKTAVNQDGRSVTPITKPSMSQQQQLLQGIYSASDVARVQYIEAHGTGTTAGDPTEAGSISNIIAKAKPARSARLWIGSVKGNIGHTESAAGVAGLIKVLLMMKHQTIVPSLFYSEDRASIDATALGFRIPVQAERWKLEGSQRVAGINSFGFGGTNAHAIVKEFQQTDAPTQVQKGCPNLFIVSAASEKSLKLSLTDVQQRLCAAETPDFQALSYTSACGRSHSRHKHRKSFHVSSLTDLKHQLASSLKTKTEPPRPDVQLGFVFCGNGAAYRGMCQQLRDVPAFRDKIKQIDGIFQHHKGTGISQWLTGEDEDHDVSTPSVVQPFLFAIQVGLVAALKHWGVTPDFVLGHSVGEVAAAHSSGLLSLEEAVKVLHLRSSLQNKVTGGKMLLVSNVSVEEVLETLPEFSGKVCVAAFNSPQSCTLSGDADAVDRLRGKLRAVFSERGLFLHELDVPAAYHSHMMDPILDDIEKGVGLLRAGNKECKLYSTVTGRGSSDGDFRTGRYWARNIREAVLFEQTLQAVANDMQAQTDLVFVEISPRRALQRNIRETLGERTLVLPAALPGSSYDTLMSTLGKLFELGINVDWQQVYRGFETLPTNFPIYQFVCAKKEVDYNKLRQTEESASSSPHGVLSQVRCGNQEFRFTLSLESASYLWEHRNGGVPVVPGALFVELAFASVMANLRPKKPVSLLQVSVKFESPFTLKSNCHQFRVKLEHPESGALFKIQSSSALHASGSYRCSDGCVLEEPHICPDAVFQRCKGVLKQREIYLCLHQAGFEYGSVFKQLHDVYFGDEFREAVTVVQLPGEIQKELHEYFIHPILLDSFLQMTAAVAMRKQRARPGFPSAIGSVRISGPCRDKVLVYLRATKESPDSLEVCGSFSTTDGLVLVELRGVRISFLGKRTNVQSCFYHNELTAIPAERNFQTGRIKALVFEDKLGVAEGLRPYLHADSALVENGEHWTEDELHEAVLRSCSANAGVEDVLFLWGVEDLSHMSSEKMLDSLVTCCQRFCRILLALKESKRSFSVRVVTHRSTETTVDRLSTGLVLPGLTRACAAEMVELSFQLIDLASVTSEDIKTLVGVLHSCNLQEVTIHRGEVLAARIERTAATGGGLWDADLPNLSNFSLQTADPYRMVDVSSIRCGPNGNTLPEKSVEIRLSAMCAHTYDYFPVTTSQLKYGRTLYWKDDAAENYQLLSLDFSGVVSAVGKDVSGLSLGDHVACCYPVASTASVVVPEAACYSTQSLVFLKDPPCVSYFILAWEILQRLLSGVKHQHKKLLIVASSSASALVKVLALTANRSGWNVSVLAHFSGHPLHFHQSHAFVFFPPFDSSWQDVDNSSGHERHLVFVCSDRTSPAIPANTFALKKLVHVHHLDVAQVFERANLQAHNRRISSWLLSLRLDRTPLKRDIIQLSSTRELLTNKNTDSYFTMTTVQQIVLKQRNSDCGTSDIPLLSKLGRLFRQACVYIITGGLSGLGLETVKFIAHHGGGCIATLSRRSLSNETLCEMESLRRRYGVRILNVRCDISVWTQVADAISEVEKTFPSCPIAGVFHSAAVLHDVFIENLDLSLFRKVLLPKVSGALNLHRATLSKKLDFFVCYSSISSFIGNPSQANYAAANSFLDIFCHYRRKLGLAGQSINWGPLNVGLLLDKGHFQTFLEAKGMMVMDVSEIHEALEESLKLNKAQQVICKFNFKNLNIHVLSQNASLRDRLAALVRIGLKDDVDISPDTEPVSSPHRHGNVRSIISDIIGVSIDDLKGDTSLQALGMDSMLAMSLQNKLFQEMGVNVPLVKILDPNVTLATLESLVLNNT